MEKKNPKWYKGNQRFYIVLALARSLGFSSLLQRTIPFSRLYNKPGVLRTHSAPDDHGPRQCNSISVSSCYRNVFCDFCIILTHFKRIHDELYSNIQTIDILAFERFETINFFRWLLKLVIAGRSTEIIDYKLIIVMLKGFENLIYIFVESLD